MYSVDILAAKQKFIASSCHRFGSYRNWVGSFEERDGRMVWIIGITIHRSDLVVDGVISIYAVTGELTQL